MFIEKGFKEGIKFQARYGKAAKFLASNMLNEAWKNSGKNGNFATNVLSLEPQTEEERQWKKWYDEFNLNGGPTGHAYLMPLDQVKSDVEKYIKRIKRNKLTQMASMTNPLNLLRLMESLSGYGESIARFTAYSMARERGASIISAINEAKEITTNFDSKGELAPVFGSFIMFYNASIQGAAKQFNLAKNHSFRYFLVNAVSLMAQGFLTGFMWDLMNGDDDDKDYSEITKYTQYNNTVIGWKDNYVTVPLPQGFRVWNAIGRGLYEHQMGRLTAEQYAFDMSEMFLDALSPADFGSIFDKEGKISGPKVAGTLMSVSKPWMDISVNENFRKNPIYKEPFLKSQEGRFADSQMHFNNTNFAIVSLTDWLFKKGGGDPEIKTKTVNGKQIPEIYDLNPAKIEYILKSYTGGPGQTILDATNALMLATLNDADKRVKGIENKIEGFDPANIPIIQSYYHRKYTGRVYHDYREIANKADVLKFEESQRTKKPDQEYSSGLTDDQIDFLIEFDMHDSEIKDLLQEQKGIEDDSLKKALDLKILILRRSIVSKYKYFEKQ